MEVEAKDTNPAPGAWPFQTMADQLLIDCLDLAWETRHGAALALREILSCQAVCAAVAVPITDPASGMLFSPTSHLHQRRQCLTASRL